MAVERSDRSARQRSRVVRWAVLGFVLVATTAVAVAHQYLNVSKPPGVDALCPFGGLETLYTYISGAGFIEKTAASALVLLGASVGLTLVFRRSFCGQLCPLGTLQGLFGSLGKRLAPRRPTMPRWLDRPARFLKYGILGVFTIWTWQAATLVMRPYDPWVAFTHLTSEELLAELGIGLAVLGVSLAGSLVYDRFFCKYLCPMGAFLGLFSKLSLLRIRRDPEACVDCGKCDRACPMNVGVSDAASVTASECVSCNECVNACPTAGALSVEAPGRRRIAPWLVTGSVAAIVALSIGVANVAGAFSLRMPTLAESLEQQAPAGEAEAFDPSLIKGYMTMQEISDASGIPPQEFTEKWGVAEADLGAPMKDIKEQYDFSPDDVRVWVEERLGR